MSAADFDRAAAQVAALGRVIPGALPSAARAGAQVLEPEVKHRAPQEDGDLQASIGNRPGERSQNTAEWIVFVGVFYASFVEYGHGGPHPAPAHPFMRPAADAKQGEIARAIEGVIKAQVRFVIS